jgi:hypothetical protein
VGYKFNPFSGQLTPIADSANANVVLPDVDCDVSVSVGDWVRMDSFGVAQKAQADVVASSNVIGLVETKPTTTTANIRVLGVSEAIFVGLDVTKEYLLSEATAGAMTVTAPTGSGNVILKLGQPYSSTQFLVLKGERIVRA